MGPGYPLEPFRHSQHEYDERCGQLTGTRGEAVREGTTCPPPRRWRVLIRRLGVLEAAGRGGGSLGHAGAADVRGAHLRQHLVQPLQGAVQVQLDPAGGAGHCLPPGRDTTGADAQ